MFSFDKIASIFSETKLAETNTVVSDLDGKKCASQVEETQKTSGTEMKKVSSNESPSSSGIYNTFILFNSFFLSLMLVTVKQTNYLRNFFQHLLCLMANLAFKH